MQEDQQQVIQALRRAHDLSKSCESLSIEEIVDLVLNERRFYAIQKRAEILQLLLQLRAIQPTTVLEIGTAAGGTLFLLTRVAAQTARLLTLDLHYTRSQEIGLPALARAGQRITCLAGDSHAPETYNMVRAWLGSARLDFLFIDGDHSLAGVTQDYELYAPLVRPDGLIAFHDIVPDSRTRLGIATRSDTGQVPMFWASLKSAKGPTWEFVEDNQQDGFGIGLLRKSTEPDT